MTQTSTDLNALASEAFIYGYPLVESVGAATRLASGPVASVSAPVNTFGHSRELVTPEEARRGGVVSPNSDTLYSVAVVKLAAEPLFLQVPDIVDRYYVLQFIDAWTNNFAYVGSRSAGEHAGSFLLVPPAWVGEVPANTRVIRAPTPFFVIAGRFLVKGSDDLEEVHRLQDLLTLRPLSARYSSIPIERSFGDIDLPLPAAGVPPMLAFWERLRCWSKANPPHPDDIAYQQRFEPLGLLATESPYLNASPELTAVLVAAEAHGRDQLSKQAETMSDLRNNWVAPSEVFNYNQYFFEFGTINIARWKIADPARRRMIRALAAHEGLWGNHAYEAFYPMTYLDENGEPLAGENRYILHFDSPPPVDAFWSITMYDVPDFLPVENRIHRYAIGDRTRGLQPNRDGSLDIFVQQDVPGASHASNWLPAPPGRFRPILRMYNPRAEAFSEERWHLPSIRKVA